VGSRCRGRTDRSSDLQVRFFDRGSNLHRVWDSEIIARAERNEDRWLALLIKMDTPDARAAAMSGTVEDWATESLLAAREAYQDPATARRIKPGAKLADDYQARSLPVAKRRLHQASIRLAWVLNQVIAENSGSRLIGMSNDKRSYPGQFGTTQRDREPKSVASPYSLIHCRVRSILCLRAQERNRP
jgi:hypothetical protein